jgi:hypothetical protein
MTSHGIPTSKRTEIHFLQIFFSTSYLLFAITERHDGNSGKLSVVTLEKFSLSSYGGWLINQVFKLFFKFIK